MVTVNEKTAALFAGWDETMVWSCLQGCMGRDMTDDPENPTAAWITVGDFCFLVGIPNLELVQNISAPILVPRTENWNPLIDQVFGKRAKKASRYAIKKESDSFDRKMLVGFMGALPMCCNMQLINQHTYELARGEAWSADLCAQFEDYEDYRRHGLGVAVLVDGHLVAGASSYSFYRGGIEIEIDTRPEYRRRGLATACGAKLILECLDRKLYPSWDAHDLRSVALAEKFGYHLDHEYSVYVLDGC